LCSDIIIVPPLRERIREAPDELENLLVHTVERIVGKPSIELARMVEKALTSQLEKNYTWPGNVRELGQYVRRILLKRTCTHASYPSALKPGTEMEARMDKGNLSAQDLLKDYCRRLYDKHGTLGEVSRITLLDRRTVKKYIEKD
jgi:transcriptional regulator with GAF, ATPase, and Fis domain